MMSSLNFDIKPAGAISQMFLANEVLTFDEATYFVRSLPYGRNKNKEDLTTLFTDRCGTCSTKHALLKQLANENGVGGLKLMLGVYRMNARNTPEVAATLKRNHLDYLPEAHNYLKWENRILDFTNKASKAADFEQDVLEEIEIQAYQITAFKVDYHKRYIAHWLLTQPTIDLTLDELWMIRERCIADLSG